MKKFTLLFWILLCIRAFGASPSFQQASNLPAYFASSLIRIGNSNTGFTITATNSTGIGQGMPFVLWNNYIDYNTNIVFVTNHPVAAANQKYDWWGAGNVYTNANNARILSNSTAFAWGFYGLLGGGGGAPTHTNVFLIGSPTLHPWANQSVGTNTQTITWWPTNSVWSFQTFGQRTNLNGLTNGEALLAVSNTTLFLYTAAIGGTNVTTTKIAP